MNIHSYGHFKILNDDINENLRDDLIENMHRIFERAVGIPITMDYDGSGSGMMTLESSTSFTTLPTTTVSIIGITIQSSQSTTSVTTNSVYPTSTSMTVELSTVTSTQTTTTTTNGIWITTSFSTLSTTTIPTTSVVTSEEVTTLETTSRSTESHATNYTLTTNPVSMTSEIITNTLTNEVTSVSIPSTMSTQTVFITTDDLTSTDVFTFSATTLPTTMYIISSTTTTSTSPTTTDTTTSTSTLTTATTTPSTSTTTTAITTASTSPTTTAITTASTSITTTATTAPSTSTTTTAITTASTSITTTATTTPSTSTTTTAITTASTSPTTTAITTASTSTTTTAITTASTSITTTATTAPSTSTTTTAITTASTSPTTTAITTTSTSITTTATTTPSTSPTTTAITTASTSITTTATSTSSTSTTTAATTTSTSPTTTATSTSSTSPTTTSTTTSTSPTTTATSTSSTSPTTTATTTASTSTYSPCSNSTDFIWWNNTCISKNAIQVYTVNALRNLTSNASVIADLLSLYVDSITSSNTSFNDNNTLSMGEIDSILANINSSNLIRNTINSILIVQTPNQLGNITVLGASFTNGVGGTIAQNSNLNATATSQYSAAAIISAQSLTDITSLSMLIIGNPLAYQNIDQSNNKTLASSIIVASVKKNNSSPIPTNISLSFQPLNQWRPSNINYFCSFYDTNTLHWNESGCTTPILNTNYTRYECSCNHLTSFALLWSQIPPFNPETCPTTDQIRLINGTCVSTSEGAAIAANTLRNSSNTNSTATAQQLSIYISSISNSNTSINSNVILTPTEIDNLVGNLTNVTFVANTTSSFIIAQPPIQGNNIIVLGASFVDDQGGNIVNNVNQNNIINSLISTAALVNRESLVGVISLNMLIIGNPSTYRTIDNSSNKTLASSVIVASVLRNTSVVYPIDISLYFQVLPDFKPNNTDVDYYCSYFDTLSSQWNESGCTTPNYNQIYNRYECSCTHLTSFALIWLPKGSLTRSLDAQDIASLVFQSISILCFLAVITHALFIRLRDPLMSLQAYDLLPLISSASTTLLFIFYIALGMTVYTRTSSSSQTQCFTSSSVLMFIVYFFLIFMFCTKTSVGYFNYLRFVHLFPQPRFLKLVKMLIISFFVSMTWVSFAIGFNSNSSFGITQLYPYKLCWFTKDVLHYFLTIPAGIFVLINIILFICIAYRIVNHVRYATTTHQTYERMKRCVLVLLSSCLSQGIGWLFGPVLSFVDPTAGEVLGWFFIIFNGLEGLWSILLYLIIRSKHMDIEKRVFAAKTLETVVTPKHRKYKMSSVDDIDRNETNNRQKTSVMNNQWVQDEELPNVFDDLADMREITFSTNTFGIKNDDLIEFSY